jgi:hypothetical protein
MSLIDDVQTDQIVVVGRASTRDRAEHSNWVCAQLRSLSLDPKDLTVQVKLTIHGEWHRKAIGGKQTACGQSLGGYASRDESYAGMLCEDGCFSPHELLELARLTAGNETVPDVDDDDDRKAR